MGDFEQKGEVSHALVAAARLVPHQVKLVKLSKTQLRVLGSIKQGEEVTAQYIAKRCGLSPSWASSLLRQLNERRYLTRASISLERGGTVFTYYRSN
ncbi:MarR family transcriptional regulator [Vibrio cyclitrophicus]|uniref:MarR family transcriptional regulator n=1 Tax=Vibrio TaxID=662 RepID=UPI000D3BF4C3|nr:helix-turn-helix domain-containing protein [Vibrio splendidus]PTO69254.1 MarR family transcriptional regulator [Vibrio splendidus]